MTEENLDTDPWKTLNMKELQRQEREEGVALADLLSRRVIYQFKDQMFLDCLNWWKNPHRRYLKPKDFDLPQDAICLGVFFDAAYRSISLIYCHPSFEKVAEGARMPTVAPWQYEFLTDEDYAKLDLAPQAESENHDQGSDQTGEAAGDPDSSEETSPAETDPSRP